MTFGTARDARGHGRISKTTVHLSWPADQTGVLRNSKHVFCLQNLLMTGFHI